MNALEIYKYIEEKGYSHSHLYNLVTSAKNAKSPETEFHGYTIRVYKDYPKSERFSKNFYGDSIIELFYAIQSEL